MIIEAVNKISSLGLTKQLKSNILRFNFINRNERAYNRINGRHRELPVRCKGSTPNRNNSPVSSSLKAENNIKQVS